MSSSVCRSEELQASGSPVVRTVRQLPGIRTDNLVAAASPVPVRILLFGSFILTIVNFSTLLALSSVTPVKFHEET